MARTGISYFDVEQTALQLQGQVATIDNIRATLGTGSRTTIADHLKAWKTRQADGEGKLPSGITALITGLWERLQEEANQQVGELRRSNDEERQKNQRELNQTYQTLAELKKELHNTQESYAASRQLNEDNTRQIQHLQQSNATSLIREQALADHVEASQKENDRLHQLAKQMQANLTHYQTSIESLRTEQTLALDKQKTVWQQEMDALKKSLIEAQLQSKLVIQPLRTMESRRRW
jgi:chromosome segregation ATPase